MDYGKSLQIGITANNARDGATEPDWDLATKFARVSEAGIFDYIDMTPAPDEVEQCLALRDRYRLPVRAGGGFYQLGKDEARIEQNLRIGARLGSSVHNVQFLATHADEHLLTDQEIAEAYLRISELGDKLGCYPSLETHIYAWSEGFSRILAVADRVEAYGVPFRITLDPSHAIFKLGNPDELSVFDQQALIERGELVLDPRQGGNVYQQWLQRRLVFHAHARCAVPGGSAHASAVHPDGRPGRGIQYPIVEPSPEQWDQAWQADKLLPWKTVMQQILRHHARDPHSPLRQISTEFIPTTDYGAGTDYSLFEQAVACADWLRSEWHACTR